MGEYDIMSIMKKSLLALCLLNAAVSAFALSLDFTAALPPDGRPRGHAAWADGGLVASQIADINQVGGYQLKRLVPPPEAFHFAAEFLPDRAWTNAADQAAAAKGGECILYDDMYVTYLPKRQNAGLQVAFAVNAQKVWTPLVYLGFSNTTACVRGPAVRLADDSPVAFAFDYDANGAIRFDFKGEKLTAAVPCLGGVFPTKRNKPVIGDRVGGNYHPFRGVIRKLAIEPRTRARFGFAVTSGRKAFVRGEEGAVCTIAVRNFSHVPLAGARLIIEQRDADGRLARPAYEQTLAVLPAEGHLDVRLPVETRLRPGWGRLVLSLKADGQTITDALPLGIGPRFADRLPVVMWSYSGTAENVRDFGFTHGHRMFGAWTAPASETSFADARDLLDRALVAGLVLTRPTRVVYPGKDKDPAFLRKDRAGEVIGRKKPKGVEVAPEISNPQFPAAARALEDANAAAFGDHPAFGGVLPCSELRDATVPSFNTEHLKYRAETGRDVPPEVVGKTLNAKVAQKLFPDGVVPEDDPILAYYRWFWSGGDGWPAFTGAVAEAYRAKIAREGFFSFWDPAVRCPPRWGSGGAVDLLNQWVYAVPEPMTVAGPCEELFAMAAGRPGQKVGIMTQLICYRNQMAPMNVTVTPTPEWVTRLPKADFPTIPPDTLQEATWSMLAKPVQAIMYHGWGTIFDTGAETGYAYTCPASATRLKELLTGVVAALGPTLKKLGRAEPEVAVFESFTTCAMGGPASWGWKAPAITFFQRARLDPKVVYEETILRDGLGGLKVLYAPQCRHLTPPVIAKIKAFQAAGGILVADDQLVSALQADVKVPVVSFERPPASDHTEDVNAMEAAREGDQKTREGTLRAKAKMLAQAERLRADLTGRYAPAADSSSPEIAVYSRRWKEADYVFAINDRRTFGDYVGPWGLTMEKGLPFSGTVTKRDAAQAVKAVYELSRGGEVPFTRTSDRVAVQLDYATNDGRLLFYAREKIAKVDVQAPAVVKPGAAVAVALRVMDAAGRPIAALLPVEVRLYDAAGRELDGAGFVCAEGGVAKIDIPTNLDDAPGAYHLVCRDRASGLSVERRIAVQK